MSARPTSLEESVLNFNRKAMHDLKEGQTEQAFFLLNEALSSLSLVKASMLKHKLLAICYNNLGFFYKSIGDFPQAARYLAKALEHEVYTGEEVELIAGTHLNFSSVLSAIGEHERALRHCLKAIQLLKNKPAITENLVGSLVTAYHNAGIEYEYLGLPPDAIDCYLAGYFLAIEKLGRHKQITQNIRRSLDMIQAKVGTRPRKKKERTNVKEYFYDVIANRHKSEHFPYRPKSKRKLKTAEKRRKTIEKVRVKDEYPVFSIDFTPAVNYKMVKTARKNEKTKHLGKFKNYEKVNNRRLNNSENWKNLDKFKTPEGFYYSENMKYIENLRRKEKLNQRIKAACRIQAWWRGFKVRKIFAKENLERKIKIAKLRVKNAEKGLLDLEESKQRQSPQKTSQMRKSIYRYEIPPEKLLEKVLRIQRLVRDKLFATYKSQKVSSALRSS